jgi:diguanylate cyclase (GGDEF)-like protein
MNKFKNLIGIISIVTALLLVYLLGINKLVRAMEFQTLDWRIKLAYQNSRQISDDFVTVNVDYDTFRIMEEFPEIGLNTWPWPRAELAKIIDYIQKDQPKAILLLMILDNGEVNIEEIANKNNNIMLVDALNNAKKLVLADRLSLQKNLLFEQIKLKDTSERIHIESYYFGKDLTEQEQKYLDKFGYKFYTNTASESMLDSISYSKPAMLPERFLEAVQKIGIINLPVSEDGIIRTITPVFRFKTTDYYLPSIFLSPLLSGEEKYLNSLSNNSLVIENKEIPLINNGEYLINWKKQNLSNYIPMYKLIVSQKQIEQALDVLHNRPINYSKEKYETIQQLANSFFIPSGTFKDKIVIITKEATHSTAINNTTPISYLVSNVLDSLMYDDKHIIHVNPLIPISFVIVFAFILGILTRNISSGLSISIIIILALLSYIAFSSFLFQKFLFWVDIVLPVIIMALMFVAIYTQRYKQTQLKLEHTYKLASLDGLTGLYNHRYFQEKIRSELNVATRKEDSLSLLLIDIDYFKNLNDTYGHRTGDAVLIQVGQTLIDSVRSSDIVARYGGEEFCVILDKTDTEEALRIAQKICKSIDKTDFYFDGSDRKIHLTISIGVANYPQHAKTVEDLVEAADKSLYRAKNSGRNKVGPLEDFFIRKDETEDSRSLRKLEYVQASFEKALNEIIHVSIKENVDPAYFVRKIIEEKLPERKHPQDSE